jgi:short-subunit dehydrogenase
MSTALITGASSGIGAAFAQELAQRQTNLVLVARSADKLQELADKLQNQFNIKVEVIVQDLTEEKGSHRVFEMVKEKNLTIDLLINNAGMGDYGTFAERPLDKQVKIIQLNILPSVQLAHLFLQEMRDQGSGAIINVTSIAAFQPMPYISIYGATKAFLLSFSESLWAENKDYGIKVLALCPGPTESNFFEVAEVPRSMAENTTKASLTPAAEVVKDALKALDNNEHIVVTGGITNQFIVNLNRFLPRSIVTQIMKTILGKNQQ